MFHQKRVTETRDAERRALLKTPTLAGVPVRDVDIETPTGLHYIAKLFRILAVLVIVLMGIQIYNGVTAAVEMSISEMAIDAIRLLLFAGVLWGAGDLADLFVKCHCDVRATKILLGRLTRVVGQHPALREPPIGETLRRRREDIAH
jgi:hypothetical protein